MELLTGSMTKTQRTGPMSRLASGEAGIVIGTHALLEDRVGFADLGLVVVDEQHRFGVEQRAALTDKAGTPPHVLVMTATPIPRTVAMTVFGDLEISTLTELPAGRAPVQTTVVPVADAPHWVDRVWQRVREEVAAGHQVYVVCPRIAGDEPEAGQGDVPEEERADRPLSAVEEVVEELREGPLSGLRLAALHGRLAPDEKDATMRAFAGGEVDVLVSTTVIEVGVDVANATAMVLLDADRFGVSQLAPAARPGRPRRPPGAVPAGHRTPRSAAPPAGASRRSRRPPTASSSAGSTSSSAARATCSAPHQSGLPLQPAHPARAARRGDHPRRPRGGRRPARRATPTWRGAPLLAAAVEPARAVGDRRLRRPLVGSHPMTRIIGGSAGGRRLSTPPGTATRPTTDRVREALFSSIEASTGSLRRTALPRPVRRLRRRRPRGALARRRGGDPRRVRPSHRRR